MARQAKTYRLPDQTVDLIAETAERDGCSATQVIVQAIAMYCASDADGNAASKTDGKTAAANDALVAALRDQIDDLKHRNDRLDQQIEHLQLLLSQSHQLLSQRPALPAAEKGKKKGRKKKKKK